MAIDSNATLISLIKTTWLPPMFLKWRHLNIVSSVISLNVYRISSHDDVDWGVAMTATTNIGRGSGLEQHCLNMVLVTRSANLIVTFDPIDAPICVASYLKHKPHCYLYICYYVWYVCLSVCLLSVLPL